MNIKNRTIYCNDNLNILKEIDDESIDMIYLDPPFNKNKSFHAPIGTTASGASFKDIFGSDDIDPTWMLRWSKERPELYHFINSTFMFADKSDASYIQYMAARVIECHRVLKSTGSIYYHCDYTMSHYVKIMMDIIFDRNNFRNDIIWDKGFRGTESKNIYQHSYDNMLFYTKSNKYTWNQQYQDYTEGSTKRYNKLDENGKYALIKRKRSDGTVYYGKSYLKSGKAINEVISDIKTMASTAKERTGYPTQKPLALIKKIISASTNEGGIVLDPFCGCATACVAAEEINRQWIGIDISSKAFDLVRHRLGSDTGNLFSNDIPMTMKIEPPKRSKFRTEDKKWVYIISNDAYADEFKVGIATNWKTRLASYQTSDPARGFKMEYKVLVPNWLELESSVHEHFDNRHEWVRAELEEIKQFIKSKL